MHRKHVMIFSWLAFGYAFLYMPIVLVVLFSFNAARSVTQWQGFSLRWYHKLFADETILTAAQLSIKIAFISATVAVLIGTLAAIVMTRYRPFRSYNFFNGLVTAPLVMPDVMIGLSLLLLFVMLFNQFGFPDRGMVTITVGHVTVAIAYVVVIVRARLIEFDHALEEAALDLGARPMRVFFTIKLPLLAPALLAGWLLAFTISFDDLILASFLSGPDATTLPMIIFSSVRFGIFPEINVVATLILFVVLIGVTMYSALFFRQQKDNHKR